MTKRRTSALVRYHGAFAIQKFFACQDDFDCMMKMYGGGTRRNELPKNVRVLLEVLEETPVPIDPMEFYALGGKVPWLVSISMVETPFHGRAIETRLEVFDRVGFWVELDEAMFLSTNLFGVVAKLGSLFEGVVGYVFVEPRQ